MFGTDPFWLVLVKTVVVFIGLVVIVMLTIWFERRVVGRMQNRIGPNRAGPQGLLQTLVDGIKLALKEEIIPITAHKAVYWLAPFLSAFAAFAAFAVIPFGPTVSMFGIETQLQLADFPQSVLYLLAVASIGIYGIVLSGWASGSTYPLLGGLRSSAQMISYELAMSLSFVAVFMYAGSMSTSEIVIAQEQLWFCVLLLPSFVIYVTAMVGETNRAPFDLPEAESELVGGFHTEYSSMKFAMFFLGEYINMITVSSIATTLFLGGYLAPWPFSLIPGINEGWWTILFWFVKVVLFVFMYVWLRGTLPRYRYDQFMAFGWKVLIPFALAWVVLTAAVRAFAIEYFEDVNMLLLGVGVMLVGVFIYLVYLQIRDARRAREPEPELPSGPMNLENEGFPVPPLPGQTFEYTPRASTTVSGGTEQEEVTDG
ncbi:MAG: NADH-quinone oxidoreductase subunit NuoH [Actinobacteria bacterium]|nr:NADH-quinone oxidoreductase subunit NuoH [Actinomycetota bacterium]